MNRGFIKRIICSLCLLVLAAPPQAQEAFNRVLIVKSSENAYFDRTISTLIDHVDRAVGFQIVTAETLTPDLLGTGRETIIVNLGQAAVTAVRQLDTDIDSINSYLTHEQYQSLPRSPRETTVLLDQPLSRYLAFCKVLLHADSIGILERDEVELDPGQQDLLRKLGLDLHAYRIDARNKLLPVLRNLLYREDTLLMLPRQSIYNRDSLKGVLLTAYRNLKPVISYSPAHVKSGALASIYSSPTDIGKHLALVVNRRRARPDTSDAPVEFALYYTIATNATVARALGIRLPPVNELRSELERVLQ